MAKDYTNHINEILITLKNINDNLHDIEDELFALNQKVNRPSEMQTMKHIVVVKNHDTTPKKAKDEENGKIS